MRLPLNIEAGRAAFSLPAAAGSSGAFRSRVRETTPMCASAGPYHARSSEGGQTSIEATLVPGVQANIWWTTREFAAPIAPRSSLSF